MTADLAGNFNRNTSTGVGSNAWYTNGTTDPHDGQTGDIHHNGNVHVGDGSTDSAVRIHSANNVGSTPDIEMEAQGLITSESNQFYHSRTGVHQFLGGNTSGTTGAIPLAQLEQSGRFRLYEYGDGDFTGTPTYNLSVNTNGYVIERPYRLANPGDPTITTGGAGTLNSTVILDRWSTDYIYSYRIRSYVTMAAGIGWFYLVIPSKVGFQQPKIGAIGSYRATSNSVQNDNSGGNSSNGASPFGPFMGAEWHHWSSTNRIYNGYYRRDNGYSVYVEFTVDYLKT